jgi:hypothetical protein
VLRGAVSGERSGEASLRLPQGAVLTFCVWLPAALLRCVVNIISVVREKAVGEFLHSLLFRSPCEYLPGAGMRKCPLQRAPSETAMCWSGVSRNAEPSCASGPSCHRVVRSSCTLQMSTKWF